MFKNSLGHKSTKNPLFKAGKLIVYTAPLIDPDQFRDYLDLAEHMQVKG